ncbi:MAG: PAS domain-containing protein [Mailhella sp.]|nr:PAS domain-containing protein [Mailhella sp.]
MEQKDNASWGISRRPALLAGLGLAVVSTLLAVYVGSARVELKKQAVLEECQSSALAWLEGTSAAVGHWQREQKEQRLRISGSETYRLFAGDLFGADSSVTSRINEIAGTAPQKLDGAKVELSQLAEEIPHFRRLLKEYADLSGFADARIINAAGHTLLSVQSKPAALSTLQREAAVRVMQSGKAELLPVRPCTSGLMLDSFEPIFGLDEPHSPVAVFMASHSVLADLTQFSARPKPEELAVGVFLQRNEARAKAAGSPVWETVGAPLPKPVSEALSAELEEQRASLPLALRESAFGRNAVYSAALPLESGAIALEIPAPVLEHRMFQAALPVYIAVFFCWLAFLLFGLLVWWIGVGRQQKAVASELKLLHQTVSRQKDLLDSVNISLDIGLFMADVKGQIHVCNRAFASIVGMDEEHIQNQPLFSVLPEGVASDLLGRIRQTAINAREDGCELWLESGGEKRLFRVSVFPFLDAEESSLRESLRGSVVTMKDITEFRRRSERQRQQQKGLVEAFTRVEASADPYLSGHSHRMAALGELLARRMDLSEDSRNTVVMGAQLSQIGKLFIPRDLLTKSGKLTPEELAEVRKAPEHAAKILENIDFDLPIARALHEMNENPDGSGYPRGLKREEILPEALILSVLNAFCAMVSARSYREGKSVAEALSELRNPARFDQNVVELLAEVLETTEGMKAMKA